MATALGIRGRGVPPGVPSVGFGFGVNGEDKDGVDVEDELDGIRDEDDDARGIDGTAGTGTAFSARNLPALAAGVSGALTSATLGGLTPTVPTVARLSFPTATNTPHIGAHSKYLFPSGVRPSFFPFPANPPLNSTPAQIPAFGGISPRYRSVPSKPKEVIRTGPLSVGTNGPAAVEEEEVREGGRRAVGVFALS